MGLTRESTEQPIFHRALLYADMHHLTISLRVSRHKEKGVLRMMQRNGIRALI